MVADVHVTSVCFSNQLFIFNQNRRNRKCQHCINTPNPLCVTMNLEVYKSRRNSLLFLLCSVGMLFFFLYMYYTEEIGSPSGKPYYYPGFILFGLSIIYFAYDFFDNRPVYRLTDNEIYSRDMRRAYRWSEFSSYRCVEHYQKYFNRKYVELYDKTDKVLLLIEVTHTNISLSYLEKRIAKKLKRKA